MNPWEYLRTVFGKRKGKILADNKTQYTKDEVLAILDEVNTEFKKAIYNGEYIFNIETADGQEIKIKDTEFSVQSLVTNDDKYLLFLQITDMQKTLSDTDIEILAEEVNKAVKKANNIAGVLLLPPNTEISLLTAKLSSNGYNNYKFFNDLQIKSEEYTYTKPYTINYSSTTNNSSYTSYYY